MRDAIIVGGGPAGASAARLLASWGHDVLLLTKPGPASALAESLPPSCQKLFDRIGVSAAIEAARFVRSTGNTAWWGAGDERVEYFASGERGWQVDREVFDRVIIGRAREAGVTIETNATVREVHGLRDVRPEPTVETVTDSGTPRVRYERDGEPQEASARWILDCTGRAGVIARHGWRRPDPGGRTLGLVAYFDAPGAVGASHLPGGSPIGDTPSATTAATPPGAWGVPDETHTLVESWGDGWAWSVPVSLTRRCFAVMLDPLITELPGRAGLKAMYRGIVAGTRSLSRLLEGATQVSDIRAFDATSYGAHRVSGDGVLLVGDAASFVDPLSSFGVKKAMASGWLAAVVVHTSLEDASMSSMARELYESRERAMHELLMRRHAELARETAAGQAAEFWTERASGWSDVVAGEPDVGALRADADVLAAFAWLRQSESIRLRADERLERE